MGIDQSKFTPTASRMRQDSIVSLMFREEWALALQRIKSHPKEAKQAVYLNPTSRIRYSPLHVACGLPKAPLQVVQALVDSDPEGPMRPSGCSAASEEKPGRTLAPNGSSNFSLGSDSNSSALSGVQSEASNEATMLDDPGAWLPLHVAVFYGASLEVVEYLMDKFPSAVACKNGQGLLPLHLACQRRDSPNLDVVSLLLHSFPASRYIPSSCASGKTALEFLKERPDDVNPELIQLLEGTIPPPCHVRGRSLSHDELVLQSVYVEPSSTPKTRRNLLKSLRPPKNPQAPTKLALRVTSRRWTDALERLEKHPNEASVWTLCNAPCDPPCHSLPLHMALRRRAPLTVIKALTTNYPESLQAREYYGMMPLHIACQAGATLDVVQFLLEQHPEAVRVPDLMGLYPLHLACLSEACRVNVITFLLDAYPESMECRDQKGFLPSEYVQNGGHPHQRLLESEFSRGMEYWAADSNELGQMLCRRQWDAVMERLESHPEEATVWMKHPVHGKRRYALHMACRGRAPEHVIKALVDICPAAAKVEIDEYRLLPLHLAASHGSSLGAVKCLLEAFPDGATCEDSHGLIPLHLAVTEGACIDVVEALSEIYPEGVKATDRKGFTPLVYAESSFHPRSKQVLQLLQAINTTTDKDDCMKEEEVSPVAVNGESGTNEVKVCQVVRRPSEGLPSLVVSSS